MRDKKGRPIVVVTGWASSPRWAPARPTIGQSLRPANPASMRSRALRPMISRPDRRHGRFRAGRAHSAPLLCERIGELAVTEALEQSGIGRRGDFPGPLFVAVAPVEMEWAHASTAAASASGQNGASYDELLRVSSRPNFSPPFTNVASSTRSPITSPSNSAPKDRRSRSRPPARPARPRSSSASRRSAAAKPTRRCTSAPTAR